MVPSNNLNNENIIILVIMMIRFHQISLSSRVSMTLGKTRLPVTATFHHLAAVSVISALGIKELAQFSNTYFQRILIVCHSPLLCTYIFPLSILFKYYWYTINLAVSRPSFSTTSGYSVAKSMFVKGFE